VIILHRWPKGEKLNLQLFLYDANESEVWKDQKHRKLGLNVPGAVNLMIIQWVLAVGVDLNDHPQYERGLEALQRNMKPSQLFAVRMLCICLY
jgi:hypothetical protein